MAIRFFIKTIIIITSLCLVFAVTPAKALDNSEAGAVIPDLNAFVNLVENGKAGVLRGVYVKNLMALKVVQQPNGNDTFVSPINGYLTEFNMAANYGNTGMLAHNYLAGEVFLQLVPGQEIQLIYGNKETKTFVVTDIQRYQALSPNSPTSDFINLDSAKRFSASNLFSTIYGKGSDNLILQTCIFADQNPSWGRLFVIAKPITKVYTSK